MSTFSIPIMLHDYQMITWRARVIADGWHFEQMPWGHGAWSVQLSFTLQLISSRYTNFPLNQLSWWSHDDRINTHLSIPLVNLRKCEWNDKCLIGGSRVSRYFGSHGYHVNTLANSLVAMVTYLQWCTVETLPLRTMMTPSNQINSLATSQSHTIPYMVRYWRDKMYPDQTDWLQSDYYSAN